jgi:hypothetical protein
VRNFDTVKDTAPTSIVITEETLAEKINEGSLIEVQFYPDNGLEVSVGGEVIETREFILAITPSGAELKIRIHTKHPPNVGEWNDIFVTNPTLYLSARVDNS